MGKITKKSRALYIGFLCLAFVLVASLSLGFTLAKYTKSVNNSEIQGDVAAFGVTLIAPTTGSLFETTYTTTDTASAGGIENSVVSLGNTFAPGTNNGTGYTFGYEIKGNEVLVSVDVNLIATVANWTAFDADYEPVLFTIKKDVFETEGAAATTTTYFNGINWFAEESTVTASKIKRIVEEETTDLIAPVTYEAGAAYHKEIYTITWAWAFESYYCTNNDAADYNTGAVISSATYLALTDTEKAYFVSADERDTVLGEAVEKASITMTAGITAVQID